MGVLPQVLEIIFKMKRKMSNEKITKNKKNFPTYKTCFYLFLSFGPLLLLDLIIFLFLIHFKQFKVI
jgi:hypothetical protein